MQIQDTEAKLGKIYTMVGNKPVEVSELFAGDIGAIAKSDARQEIHFLQKQHHYYSVRQNTPNHIHI